MAAAARIPRRPPPRRGQAAGGARRLDASLRRPPWRAAASSSTRPSCHRKHHQSPSPTTPPSASPIPIRSLFRSKGRRPGRLGLLWIRPCDARIRVRQGRSRDYQEKDPWVTPRYQHQFYQHHRCLGTYRIGPCPLMFLCHSAMFVFYIYSFVAVTILMLSHFQTGDDSTCFDDFNYLVSQRAEQEHSGLQLTMSSLGSSSASSRHHRHSVNLTDHKATTSMIIKICVLLGASCGANIADYVTQKGVFRHTWN